MAVAVPGRPQAARTLSTAPVTLPCLLVAALCVWWMADDGGFAVSHWAPGLLLALGALAVAAMTVANAWSSVPLAVRAAVLLLVGYSAWSFLSIAWAQDPGAAWTGATRTLLPVAVFALFALWPQDGRAGAGLVALLALGVGAVATVELARVGFSSNVSGLFGDDRLLGPTGYPNATAGMFSAAALTAVVLGSARGVHPLLATLCAASAVVCLDTALLCLSRGMLFALPIAAVLVVVALPGRLRLLTGMGVVALPAAIAAPKLLDVGDAVTGMGDPGPTIASACRLVVLGALVAAALAALGTGIEWRRPMGAALERRVTRVAGIVAIAGAVLAVAAALAVAGNPVHRLDNAWHSFKGGYGDNSATANRLVGGLGSNRYDFYRVGLKVFAAHPLAGIGADNFQGEYLRRGRSSETPHYPHSIEIRALAQTGVVGFLLLFGGLAAAVVASLIAMRRTDRPARAAAAAGLAGFVYWLIHGSVDWFFEFGGMSAVAFALLGLACGLAPRRASAAAARRPGGVVRGGIVAGALILALAPLSVWGADHDRSVAARIFSTNPRGAADRLDSAASIDPFSGEADSLKGSIALRLGDLRSADAAFADALDRAPDDQYATLERGAIASDQGRQADALRLLGRAAQLAPRDGLTGEALRIARSGGRVDVDALNDRIRDAALQLPG